MVGKEYLVGEQLVVAIGEYLMERPVKETMTLVLALQQIKEHVIPTKRKYVKKDTDTPSQEDQV